MAAHSGRGADQTAAEARGSAVGTVGAHYAAGVNALLTWQKNRRDDTLGQVSPANLPQFTPALGIKVFEKRKIKSSVNTY